MAKLLTRYAVPNIAALVLLVATCCACSSKTSTQMQCAWPAEYSPVDAGHRAPFSVAKVQTAEG